MVSTYKQEEEQLRNVISKSILPHNEEKKIKLLIFYKNKKLRQLFIKNNCSPDKKEDKVVYQYSCNQEGCHTSSYVGYTTNQLSVRMKQHSYNGSIKKHHLNFHNRNIKYEEIYDNTKVLEMRPTRYEL